jgi:hypothetical protein
LKTFDDSIIEGAAENFLAGRKLGSLSEALTFEDFLAVRVIPQSGARFPVSFEDEKPAPEPKNWPPIAMAAAGITFWLIGRVFA